MGMVAEFKEFAMKGSVMDLAIGVIIGGAFGKIVDSLVGDVIMPIISAIMGGRFDFTNLYVALGKVPEGTAMTLDAVKKAGVPVFAYGNFITILINFIILAFVIFLMVKMLNRWKQEPAPAVPAAATTEEVLLGEIRDLLKRRPA